MRKQQGLQAVTRESIEKLRLAYLQRIKETLTFTDSVTKKNR